jgi:hypothetical protein
VGDDLRDSARRQPGLFLAAAGVAGFVVTRLLRNASSLESASGPTTAPSTAMTASEPGAPVVTPGSGLR